MRRLWILACLGLMAGCATSHPRHVALQASPKAKAIVRTAKSYLPEEDGKRGVPRDCSDFVGKVFAENGIRLPRTAALMARVGGRVDSSRDLRMGDLLFFSGEKAGANVGHVAIYLNNGIFIHLSKPEAGVRLESLYSDYYRKRYLMARRVLP